MEGHHSIMQATELSSFGYAHRLERNSRVPQLANIGAHSAEANGGASKNPADDEFSFYDFLDVINPLQNIPIIGNIYREITGDTIKPAAQVAGGGLFGGVVGLVLALAGQAVKDATGSTPEETLIAAVTGKDKTPQQSPDQSRETLLAAAEDAPSVVVPAPKEQQAKQQAKAEAPPLAPTPKETKPAEGATTGLTLNHSGNEKFFPLNPAGTHKSFVLSQGNQPPAMPHQHQDLPQLMMRALEKYQASANLAPNLAANLTPETTE